MRKIILIAFVCALSLKTQAQTNFQPLGYTDVLDLAKKEGFQGFIESVVRGQQDLIIEEYTENE